MYVLSEWDITKDNQRATKLIEYKHRPKLLLTMHCFKQSLDILIIVCLSGNSCRIPQLFH